MAIRPLAKLGLWLAGTPATAERKGNPVGDLLATYWGPDRPVYTPRNFEALAREGFANNGYVFRGINVISQAAAGIPWRLYQDRGRRSIEQDSHPLLDLLHRPQGGDTFAGAGDLIEQIVAYYVLSGNSYTVAIRPQTRANAAPPQELWVMRPDRMKVLLDAQGRASNYVYEVNGAKREFASPDTLHWKTFNPTNDIYGLSPVAVAARVVDQMNAGNDWNTALLQNMARPGGWLFSKQHLSDPQFSRLENLLRESYSGSRNAGKPHVLEGDLSWQQAGMSALDLDWIAGRTQNAREIAVVLGVPSEMLGDSTNKTYANFETARKSFYTETVLPLMDRLRDRLNAWLVPMWGDASLRMDYDRNEIEALQEDRQGMWDRATNSYTKGLVTLNEAREMIGFESVTEGDTFMAPPRAMTLDQLLAGAAFPKPPNPEGVPSVTPTKKPDDAPNLPALPPTDDAEKAWLQQSPIPVYFQATKTVPRVPITYSVKAFDLRTEQQKAAHWRATESNRTRWYAAVEEQVQAQFKHEHTAVLVALHEGGPLPSLAAQRAEAASDGFADDWTQLLAATYYSVGGAFAKHVLNSLPAKHKQRLRWRGKDGDDSYDIWDDSGYFTDDVWQREVVNWLGQYSGLKVQQISTTTLNSLRGTLADGVQNGESVEKLAKRIDGLYLDQLIPNRSRTIAATEVVSASNLGSLAGAKAAGVPGIQKMWISTRDAHTRPEHADADGQTVPMDGSFDVGGESLDYPGDPSGSPGMVINCRCTVGYSSPDYEDDNSDSEE